jgi:hypothetical protein
MDPVVQFVLLLIALVFALLGTFKVPELSARGPVWLGLAFSVFVLDFLGNAYKAI